MKCPFKLPIKALHLFTGTFGPHHRFENADGDKLFSASLSKDQAEYLVRATNSYWNLVEYRQYVHARIADGKPIMRYSKWLDTIKELEETFAEARLPKGLSGGQAKEKDNG